MVAWALRNIGIWISTCWHTAKTYLSHVHNEKIAYAHYNCIDHRAACAPDDKICGRGCHVMVVWTLPNIGIWIPICWHTAKTYLSHVHYE